MEIIKKYFDDFSPVQQEKFEKLKDLYAEWNEKINVISRKDIESLYERHVLHSLAIAALAPFEDGAEVMDIGTGGGFPGIPLAIFFPEVKFCLVDSIGKKINVVKAVAEALELTNIEAHHRRVEDLKGRKFDYTVSRAVAPLGDLWRWSKPVIRKGQKGELANGLICLKGGDLNQEISESGCRPTVWDLTEVFEEDHFKGKFMIHVPYP